MCMCVSMCAFLSLCVCLHVHVCVHANTVMVPTDRHPDLLQVLPPVEFSFKFINEIFITAEITIIEQVSIVVGSGAKAVDPNS